MANEILVKSGTPKVWADTTDYAGDGGTRTDQIDLTDLADGAARQGAKTDLGATRAKQYAVTVCVEMAVAPASKASVDVYWAASPHATAGLINPGGCSGADAAYTGTFTLFPQHRYGMPIIDNNGGQALHSDAIECFVALTPIIPEVQ
jgi:hypothetical protein